VQITCTCLLAKCKWLRLASPAKLLQKASTIHQSPFSGINSCISAGSNPTSPPTTDCS
jgi:hypothetical protein